MHRQVLLLSYTKKEEEQQQQEGEGESFFLPRK
jgi:hypothetical protein